MNNILTDQLTCSNFSWYWGVLCESTREKGQRDLKVYIPDLTPIRNGDVKNKGSFKDTKLFNVMTQSFETVTTHQAKYITAEYLGFESSREVPDMYKGQQVIVLNYGADDRWFWIPTERDDYIKTFEHVKFRCADEALIHKTREDISEDDERTKNLTDDNTYFIEIDTKYKKHVLISTAGTDGEKYRYFFKMDAKEHTIELWDGLVDTEDPKKKCKNVPHNTIKLESDPSYSQDGYSPSQSLKGRITLQNEAGATLLLEGEDVKLVVPRDFTLEVGRNVIFHNKGDFARTVEGNDHTKVKNDSWNYVGGKNTEQTVGIYSQLCNSDKFTEVQGSYTRSVKLDTTENTLKTHTVNCDTLVVNALTAITETTKTYTFNCSIAAMTAANSFTIVGMTTSITGAQLTALGNGKNVAITGSNITGLGSSMTLQNRPVLIKDEPI